MYKCNITHRTSRPGEKLNRIAIITRTRQYKHFDHETEEEWFSTGTEIVKEINANDEGQKLWDSWDEQQRHAWLLNARYIKDAA